jgi:leucyl/phenylalanyl-tRNA---protein transferase
VGDGDLVGAAVVGLLLSALYKPVWEGGDLVGGLYGVQRGGLFAAESMFHRRTNASKVALCTAVLSLFYQGITVFDVQFLTDHLESLGAFEIPRTHYLQQIAAAVTKQAPVFALAAEDPLDIARDQLSGV